MLAADAKRAVDALKSVKEARAQYEKELMGRANDPMAFNPADAEDAEAEIERLATAKPEDIEYAFAGKPISMDPMDIEAAADRVQRAWSLMVASRVLGGDAGPKGRLGTSPLAKSVGSWSPPLGSPQRLRVLDRTHPLAVRVALNKAAGRNLLQ